MVEAPWLSPAAIGVAVLLLASHQRAFGLPLLAAARRDPASFTPIDRRRLAQELFAGSVVVLAHDGSGGGEEHGDPRLIYANASALRLWRRPWAAMVGMPSRLTAEPGERASRARLLATAREREAITGYTGIRIDSSGRRFVISGARLWTLRDARGNDCGQAAAFADWWWL